LIGTSDACISFGAIDQTPFQLFFSKARTLPTRFLGKQKLNKNSTPGVEIRGKRGYLRVKVRVNQVNENVTKLFEILGFRGARSEFSSPALSTI
jgi:hypothetical protein